MEISYLDFSSDFIQEAVSRKPAIYVADNECLSNLGLAQGEYEKKRESLVRQSRFMGWSELKEILFPSAKITLREEKLSVVLFELLTAREKQELEINNYNDVIDFAARFHRFYRELNEYQVKDLPALEGWQKERYDLLQSLRDRYREFLARKGFTDTSLICSENNFSPEVVTEYEELVLLNTFDITPFEQSILSRLEDYINIKLYLQLPKNDFAEKKLEFKGLSLPASWPGEINLYTAEEDILQLASALEIAEPETSSIFSPKLKDTNYHRLLAGEQIELPRDEKFSQCRIYKFVFSLYRILVSTPPGKKDYGLGEVYSALGQPFFRHYFQLNREVREQVRQLARDNFLYLDRQLASDRVPGLKPVLKEMEQLSQIRSMPELISYMDQLNLEVLADPNYQNDIGQFYDSLLELSALEEMELVSSWASYYGNPATGLLDRLLQYLEYKRVQPPELSAKPRLKMMELLAAPHCFREHVVVLNARQNWLPAAEKRKLLWTEVQRQEMGLPTAREIREKQRYYFFRHLLTAGRADILALDNREENESPGAFMEELKLNYGLEYQTAPVTREHYPDFYRELFASGEADQDKQQGLLEKEGQLPLLVGAPDEIETEKDPLITEKDFIDSTFSLTYYKYSTMIDCYFRFFCGYLMNLDELLGDFEHRLQPLTFGNIVHSLAEKMMNLLTVGRLEMDNSQIADLITETLNQFELKIDHRFAAYYHRVVKKELITSLREFLRDLKDLFSYHDFFPQNMEVEFTPRNGAREPIHTSRLTDFYPGGRIDLLFSGRENDLLIDFKTGSMNKDQLDFYALLLNQKQENKNGQAQKKMIYKYFYQVLDREFVSSTPGSEIEFRAELKEELEKFTDSKRFIKHHSSQCQNCSYKNICRVVKER
ncbi:MAG: PD-(D/E)XK nuclease family protein [Bacillota bacterium]